MTSIARVLTNYFAGVARVVRYGTPSPRVLSRSCPPWDPQQRDAIRICNACAVAPFTPSKRKILVNFAGVNNASCFSPGLANITWTGDPNGTYETTFGQQANCGPAAANVCLWSNTNAAVLTANQNLNNDCTGGVLFSGTGFLSVYVGIADYCNEFNLATGKDVYVSLRGGERDAFNGATNGGFWFVAKICTEGTCCVSGASVSASNSIAVEDGTLYAGYGGTVTVTLGDFDPS